MRAFVCSVAAVVISGCGTPEPPANDARLESQDQENSDEVFINAHFHSARLGMDDGVYLQTVLEEMDAHKISKSVLHIAEPSDLEDWVDAAPERFLAGPAFPCWLNEAGSLQTCNWSGEAWPDIEWMRENYRTGKMHVMGEMLFVYAGIAPTDPRMDPYWDLAAELDIPVAVHINRGPPPDSPSRPTGCCPNYDADLGNPALLRPILERYPGLKVWLQHAGFPAMPIFDDVDYTEETFSLLADYPNIYVDMTALNAAAPPHVHASAVQEFIARGFGDRIMMGTDNWEAGPILERYRSFSFLSAEQRRAILHDNATRFFAVE
ncbi:MAG: hypothetical protein Hens2KO_27410 [Henriciella sp.]